MGRHWRDKERAESAAESYQGWTHFTPASEYSSRFYRSLADGRTCFRDSSAMLCVQCFQHSNHEGHEVAFRTNYNFAPVCDCGALDLYKDPALHSCAEHVIADSSETPKEFDAAETDSPEVTEGFKEALYDTFVLCIEYIIETFQCAPPPDHYGKLPKDINDLKSTWGLTHTSLFDLARRAEGPWSVTIYADERHNEPELVRQMQHATGADYDDCSDWIRELDSVVRLTSQPGFHR